MCDMPRPNIWFIDRHNYKSLLEAGYTKDDIVSLYIKDDRDVSVISKGYMVYLNTKLQYLIGGNTPAVTNSNYLYPFIISTKEREYIECLFKEKTTLDTTQVDPVIPAEEEEKSYELVILGDKSILVVTEDCFLTNLTKYKDKLLEFILSLLRQLDSTNSSIKELVEKYLKIQNRTNYFEVLRTTFV